MLSDVSMVLYSHYQGKMTISSWFEYKWVKTIIDILFLCDHVNNLARIESVCTFKVGLRSLITSISWINQPNLFRHFFGTKSISWIKQSNLFRHFFSTEKLLIKFGFDIRWVSCMCLPTEEFKELCSATLWCRCRLV